MAFGQPAQQSTQQPAQSQQAQAPAAQQPSQGYQPQVPQQPGQVQQNPQSAAMTQGNQLVGNVQQQGLPQLPAYQTPTPQQPGQQQQPAQQQPSNDNPQMQAMAQQLNQQAQINQALLSRLNAETGGAGAPQEETPAEFEPFSYDMPEDITAEDKKLFGNTYDAVDKLTRRRAAEMMKPVLEHLNSLGMNTHELQNKLGGVDNKLADVKRAAYNSSLSSSVPDLQQVMRDPAFQQFLGQQVPYTNQTVRDIVATAHSNQDVATIYNVVSQYRQGQAQGPGGQQQGFNQQQPNMLTHQTQSTANPGMFAQQQAPVQAPNMMNYQQPAAFNGQPQTQQQPGGNGALIKQNYEQAKSRLQTEKTPEAQANFDAAAAKVFELEMGLIQ